MKVVKRIEHLPVELTDAELQARGDQLAGVIEDIGAEEERQRDERTAAKARIAALESRRTLLCLQIRRGEENRPVEVECRTDHEAGTYSRVRLDTGEVLSERPLSGEERQEGLPGVSDA